MSPRYFTGSFALWCLLVAAALAAPPLTTRLLWPAVFPEAAREAAAREGLRHLLWGSPDAARERLSSAGGEPPALVLALGLAHEKLGQRHEALALYRRYRTMVPGADPPPVQVDERIAALEAGTLPPPFLNCRETYGVP